MNIETGNKDIETKYKVKVPKKASDQRLPKLLKKIFLE